MNLGILIPTYKLCRYRLESLEFILRHLTNLGIPNVYVAEQGISNENVRESLQMFPGVKYISQEINSDVFNKSKLINHSVEEIKFKFIWIYDVDVFLDFKFVLNNIPDNVDLVRPFEKVIMLNEGESQKLKETNLIHLEKRDFEGFNSFGKFSVVLNRDIFEKIGGYDENFEGWGFQDLDLTNRIPKGCYRGYTTNTAFHLWHPRANKNHYDKNKSMYMDKSNKNIKYVHRKKKKRNNFA